MGKKWFKGVVALFLILSMLAAVSPPVHAGKGNPDHITFVKLSDIEFRDESGRKITMTKGWLKNLLKVEWGYGKYTNATLVFDGKRLTVYLQDDTKHDGRWFALNEQILKKVGIDPDAVNIKLDTQAPAEVVKRLKADGKWFYFYIDHFTVRYVTFEAANGYVELSDFGWQNYTKLIEPILLSDTAFYAPFEDMVSNGDGTFNTTVYRNGVADVFTVIQNATTGYPKLVASPWGYGNAIEFDGNGGYVIGPGKIWTSDAYTLLIRFNTTQTGGTLFTLTYSGSSSAPTITVRIHSSTTLFIRNMKATAAWLNWYLDTGKTLTDGNPHTLVFSLVGSSVNVYLDGELIGSRDDVQGANYNSGHLVIGAYYNDYTDTLSEFFSGIIDEVMFFDGIALSEQDVQVLTYLNRYRLALYAGDEASLPSYLDATLFCPLDDINPDNTTTCYLDGTAMSATVYFNESTGYPKLTSGRIGNAFEFDGSKSEYARISLSLTNLNSLSLVVFTKAQGTASGPIATLVTQGISRLPQLRFDGTNYEARGFDGAYYDVASAGGEFHMITYIISVNTMNDTVIYTVYNNDNLVWQKEFSGATLFNVTALYLANYYSTATGAQVVIDEIRLYTNKTLTDEEIQLLYYINRHKFATLSAPFASFNGTHFLVNVTATLPNDGGSYLLPAPINAISSYTSAGTIGNFTFLDVGTASTASFQVPVPKDLTPPAGINLLAWLYNDEIYVTGRSDQFPLIATVMNLPKGVWGLENGRVVKNVVYKDYTKLIIANVTAPDYVSRLPNFFVEPQGVDYVNVSVLQHSPQGVEINASAPEEGDVVFTIGGLWKDHRYNLYVDGDKIETLKTSDSGWLTFTWSDWSSHVFVLEPYKAGEEWFYDTIDLVAAIFAVFAVVPLLGLGYVIYLLNKTYTREGAVSEEVYNAIIQYGSLIFIIGLVGIVILVVLAYLSQML